MRVLTRTLQTTGCHNCPARDSDRDGNSYCTESHADMIECRRLYQQNNDQLTPTCPMWEQAKEKEPEPSRHRWSMHQQSTGLPDYKHVLRLHYATVNDEGSISFGFVEQRDEDTEHTFTVRLNWIGHDSAENGAQVATLEEGMRIIETLERNSR